MIKLFLLTWCMHYNYGACNKLQGYFHETNGAFEWKSNIFIYPCLLTCNNKLFTADSTLWMDIDDTHFSHNIQWSFLCLQDISGLTIAVHLPIGLVNFGFWEPKIEITGSPRYDARCPGMESVPINSFWFFSQFLNVTRLPSNT